MSEQNLYVWLTLDSEQLKILAYPKVSALVHTVQNSNNSKLVALAKEELQSILEEINNG